MHSSQPPDYQEGDEVPVVELGQGPSGPDVTHIEEGMVTNIVLEGGTQS